MCVWVWQIQIYVTVSVFLFEPICVYMCSLLKLRFIMSNSPYLHLCVCMYVCMYVCILEKPKYQKTVYVSVCVRWFGIPHKYNHLVIAMNVSLLAVFAHIGCCLYLYVAKCLRHCECMRVKVVQLGVRT